MSEMFKQIVSNGEYTCENRLYVGTNAILGDENGNIITFGNVAINVGTVPESVDNSYGEDRIVSIRTQENLFTGSPSVGNACSSEIDVEMLKPTDSEIPKRAIIVPYVRVCSSQDSPEWIQKKKYYIDSRTEAEFGNETLLNLHGYDAMIFAEADYPSETSLSWPAKDIDVVSEIANDMGICISEQTRKIMVNSYEIQYPSGYSERETLGYIAAMYASNWCINDLGELHLEPLFGLEKNESNLGGSVKEFESSEKLISYSRVSLTVSSELQYDVGTRNGRTLNVEIPWGTLEIANDILSSILGFEYQPFTATDAVIDPSVRIGDKVTVQGVTGVICTASNNFGRLYTSTISAPAEEETDEVFPYKSRQERKIERQELEMHARFNVQAAMISGEVAARKALGEELRATLKIQTDSISAKVDKSGGTESSFGWDLNDSSWTLKSNNKSVLTATKDGIEINGVIRATGGEIGGFSIESNCLTYNGQTWGGEVANGGYIGINGIQLGKNFKVDMQGNLTAATGTFSGKVNAGSIQYGETGGYLSGSGLLSNSVTGGQIAGATLSTAKFTSGVNASLGYADFANGVFNGYNTANALKVAEKNLYIGNHQLILYQTVSQDGTTIKYVGWN